MFKSAVKRISWHWQKNCNIAMISFSSSPNFHLSTIAYYDRAAFLKAFAIVFAILSL